MPTPTRRAKCKPRAGLLNPSWVSSPKYNARNGKKATWAIPRIPATVMMPHNLGWALNDSQVWPICSLKLGATVAWGPVLPMSRKAQKTTKVNSKGTTA